MEALQTWAAPTLSPPTGEGWVAVSPDGHWYWNGAGWQPTAPAPAQGTVTLTPDGFWYWTGYGWAPTLAGYCFWQAERERRRRNLLMAAGGILLLFR